MKSAYAISLAAILLLSGCDTNQQTGRIIGGIAGAGIGNQFGRGDGKTVATVAGALIGSAIGEEIGKDIDEKNRARMAEVLEVSKSDVRSTWVDPDHAERSYVLIPKKAYKRSKRICRPFTLILTMDGKQYTREGVACRDPHTQDWRIVD